MKRYPAYKDSGVPWLGQVPAHWEVKKVKRLFRYKKVINRGMACEDRLALTMTGVIPRALDDAEGLQTEDYSNYQIVEKDDLLFKLIDLQNIRTSRVGLVPSRGIVSPAYIRIQKYEAVSPEFGYWYFMSIYVRNIFNTMGAGVRQSLTQSDLLELPFLLPSRDEMNQIAEYVETKTSEIDSTISSQERLVELLKERRSVTITQAVTKGLDPKAKMKDSGVPWLGQVPAHWEVKGLKFLLSVNQGGAWGDEPTGLGDTIVLRSTEQTQTGEWRIEDPEVRSLSEADRKKTLLKKGDILVTKASGSEAHIGKASLVDDAVASLNAGYSNFMQRLRARPGIEPQLILFMLNSKAVRDQFVYLSNSTSGLGNISASILNNVLVAEPPESEQFGIIDFIAKECRGIDSAINKVERMIQLLKERRSVLITQAVTGQIDVR